VPWFFLHSFLQINDATVASVEALEIVRGSLGASNARCESMKPDNTSGHCPLTSFSRQTKHAAELCALLVNDLHGELPSVRNFSALYVFGYK
jgi:hypothetical protein